MKLKVIASLMLTMFLASMTLVEANQTIISDHFDSDTIASGYWEYWQINGGYNISDSKLRLYIKSEGPAWQSSVISKAVSLGEKMTLTARVLGSTLYRFALAWQLSDRWVLLEFDDFGFCVTTLIIPTLMWGDLGHFGPSPAVTNTWYILSFEVRSMPFTIIASVYDDNNNLLGSLTSDLDWNYSDIKMASPRVWTDTISNPLSDYYIDWVKVTSYYYPPVGGFSVSINKLEPLAPYPQFLVPTLIFFSVILVPILVALVGKKRRPNHIKG
jgi:hypothetical protein